MQTVLHFPQEGHGVTADRHMTVKDLAEREGVPLKTVYDWNSTNKGPRYMKIGKHVRYALADVVAWEKTRYVKPRAA